MPERYTLAWGLLERHHGSADATWEERADRSWRDPGFAQDDRHPVTCVDLAAATANVAWLSAKTGRSYRLPSETEREYATRAGTASCT